MADALSQMSRGTRGGDSLSHVSQSIGRLYSFAVDDASSFNKGLHDLSMAVPIAMHGRGGQSTAPSVETTLERALAGDYSPAPGPSAAAGEVAAAALPSWAITAAVLVGAVILAVLVLVGVSWFMGGDGEDEKGEQGKDPKS